MSSRYVTDFRGEYTPNVKSFRIKHEPITPTDDDGFGEFNNYCFDNVNCNLRKSMSMSDIATIKQELEDLKFNDDNKEHNYSRHRKQSCVQELSKTKFVSMAEQIYRFQRDTPDRFHTCKPKVYIGQGPPARNGLTRPQSPLLRCKARVRPLHVLSQKEKEELELEEIRKFHIKANPIPKSVIEGPKNLPEVQRKPTTKPEPFKLTEVHKKPPASPEPISNFKARPAPKHILEKPTIAPVKPPAPVTKAVSPKFRYKRASSADPVMNNTKKNENQPLKKEKCVKAVHHGPIKPEPFSFEKRDEELKRKREEMIKKLLEEERKLASQFKAQPLPAGVKKRMQCVASTNAVSSTSSENKENCIRFEAKPPVVLYKQPFKPVLESNQFIKPKPFDLATEKRALEREQFDKLLKEKEEENEKIMQQKEKEQQEEEERALLEMRAKLVHHPKPIPSLVPNLPEKSCIPLTVPKTPKFVRRLKKIVN